MRSAAILLVDDDPVLRELLASLLEEGQFRVMRAADAAGALPVLEAMPRPDLIVTDVHLATGSHGLSLAARAAQLEVPVLLITGDVPLAEQLEATGHSVLCKPFRLPDLIARARREIERSSVGRARLRANLLRLQENAEQMLQSAARLRETNPGKDKKI